MEIWWTFSDAWKCGNVDFIRIFHKSCPCYNFFRDKINLYQFFFIFFAKKFGKTKMFIVSLHRHLKTKGTTMNTLQTHHTHFEHATVMSTMLAKCSPKWKVVERFILWNWYFGLRWTYFSNVRKAFQRIYTIDPQERLSKWS